MSRIAKETGIGRATLYKYFPDVDAILVAWHDRHVGRHLEELAAARDSVAEPGQQLEAVLRTYAAVARQRPGTELAAAFHRTDHVVRAGQHLQALIGELIVAGAKAGMVREDVPPKDLTQYVMHALGAAGALSSDAAVRRLVDVTLDGLRPAGPVTDRAQQTR